MLAVSVNLITSNNIQLSKQSRKIFSVLNILEKMLILQKKSVTANSVFSFVRLKRTSTGMLNIKLKNVKSDWRGGREWQQDVQVGGMGEETKVRKFI
jgi:hypothetical protein